MKIIIGLGNPGEKYKHTRHNIGFSIVDAIAEKYSKTKWIRKFHGVYSECWFDSKKFLVLKPETFMNNSGKSAASISNFYKLNASEVIVIHDELDLEIGQIKLKFSGGHAGHNGLRSIHQAIGQHYTRIRIGIGRPTEKTEISSYVLSNFTFSQNQQMEAHRNLIVCQISRILNEEYHYLIT